MPETLITHRVIANHGARALLQPLEGGDGTLATPLKKLPLLVAGDEVMVQNAGGVGESALQVVALAPRRSVLARPDRRGQMRPLAANLTHLAIVSADPPGVDRFLLDQFCVAAEHAGLQALPVFNKQDLLSEGPRAEIVELCETYQKIGYRAVRVDTVTPGGLDPLRQALIGTVAVLVGASGVGKSSIVQALLPEASVRVGAVSENSGHGAHTTTVTTFYALPNGGALIDAPGVRQFPAGGLEPVDVHAGFPEIESQAAHCRFNDCRHLKEPGCAVRDAVDAGDIAEFRYGHYLKLMALETLRQAEIGAGRN